MIERARYRELALQALTTLTTLYTRQGDLAQAIDGTRRLLALEPWREEAHRQLMQLLAQSGQRSTALAQYEICRRILDDELDVEPGAETTALYQQIRTGQVETITRWQDDKMTPSSPHSVTLSSPNQPPTSGGCIYASASTPGWPPNQVCSRHFLSWDNPWGRFGLPER